MQTNNLLRALPLISAACLFLPAAAKADVIAQYPIASVSSGTSPSSDTEPNSTAGPLTFTGSLGGPGSGFNGNLSTSSHSGYQMSDSIPDTQAAALDNTIYFTFTVTAAPGYELDLTSLTFNHGYSGIGTLTGYQSIVYVQSSVGGFGSANPVVASNTISGLSANGGSYSVPAAGAGISVDLTAPQFQNLSSITFRFSFSDTATTMSSPNEVTSRIGSAGGASTMNPITLNGTVNLVPEPSTGALIGAVGIGAMALRRRSKRA